MDWLTKSVGGIWTMLTSNWVVTISLFAMAVIIAVTTGSLIFAIVVFLLVAYLFWWMGSDDDDSKTDYDRYSGKL